MLLSVLDKCSCVYLATGRLPSGEVQDLPACQLPRVAHQAAGGSQAPSGRIADGGPVGLSACMSRLSGSGGCHRYFRNIFIYDNVVAIIDVLFDTLIRWLQ